MAVFPAQVRIVSSARPVAILDPGRSFVEGARAQVDADVRRGSQLSAERDELVRPEAVRFALEPRQVIASRPRLRRADSILPVIPGAEISARPAQLRDVQPPRRLHYVLAIPIRVGERRALIINSAIDAAAQMLDEVPVNRGVDRAQPPLQVHPQRRL